MCFDYQFLLLRLIMYFSVGVSVSGVYERGNPCIGPRVNINIGVLANFLGRGYWVWTGNIGVQVFSLLSHGDIREASSRLKVSLERVNRFWFFIGVKLLIPWVLPSTGGRKQ
jgi:hypothetical protein